MAGASKPRQTLDLTLFLLECKNKHFWMDT